MIIKARPLQFGVCWYDTAVNRKKSNPTAASSSNSAKKDHKRQAVALRYAPSGPGATVVKSSNANPTPATVMDSWRPHNLTSYTYSAIRIRKRIILPSEK